MIILLALLLLFAVPSWGFDAAITRVPINTITGLQTVTFNDFSEDCTAVTCAAIFVLTAAITDNTIADDALTSVGFADGTEQRMVLVWSNDGGTTTAGRREMRADRVIESYDGGITGTALFYDWQSNGLRIDISDAFPAAYLLTVMLMGGSDFQAKVGTVTSNAAVDGTTDVADVGFTPDTVLFSAARLDLNSAPGYVFTMGAAVNDGSSTQGSIACFDQDAQSAATNARALTSTLYAASYVDGGGQDLSLLIGSWDAAGFTATTKVVGLAANFSYMALKFGSPQFAVFDIDTRTSIGATSHTIGFRPLAGMVVGTLARTYDFDESDSDGSQCMISLFANTGQYAHTTSIEDAALDPNTTSRSDDGGIMMGSTTGTCPVGGCLRGFLILDPTALTIDYSSVYTDAVRKWIGFAVEDELAGGGAHRRGSGLLQ